jgi:hypothetical protein
MKERKEYILSVLSDVEKQLEVLEFTVRLEVKIE